MQDTDHLCELRTGQGRRSIFTGHFHRAFSPALRVVVQHGVGWWARQDSNLQQHGYEPWVLTN